MKTISKNIAPVSFENAMLLERKGELPKAVQMYEQILKKVPANLEVLTRLMIDSRKLKNYRKEITFINQAIKIHEEKYARFKTSDVKVASLSRKLNTLLGHTDKKGKNLLEIPEVEKLKKRKAVALKRLK